MKKLIAVLMLLMALSGCSITGRTSITGLLSAPKHSAAESEIVKVVSEYAGENIALKYSTSQGYVSPIQLIDVKGDEKKEAVVFYHAPNKGTNIRFALLENTDEGWKTVLDREGLGGDVFWFETVEYPGMAGKQIAVGYLASGISENFFVTYFTDEEKQYEDYVEVCENVVSKDLDGDGYAEILLTGRHTDGRTRVKAITMTEENGYKQIGIKVIRRQGAQIEQIEFDNSRGGNAVVYMDYRDDTNRIYTEVFTFENNMVKNCLSVNSVSRIWPYEKPLVSRDIDGDGAIEIPVPVAEDKEPVHPENEVDVDFHVRWMDCSNGEETIKVYGIYNVQNDMFVTLPLQWQDQVKVKNDSYALKIVRAETDEDIFSVTETEYADGATLGEYRRVVRTGTKLWLFEFDEDTDLYDIGYIIDNISVLD